MTPKHGEVRDIPFLKNDMQGGPRTTDKPLDTSDEPGRADAETGADQEPASRKPPRSERGPEKPEKKPEKQPAKNIDTDDALIDEPRDDAFRAR